MTELEPCIIVIFGISGDLAKRYLLPALYHLMKDGLLHPKTEIIGVSRQQLTAKQLLDRVELCINEEDGICDPAALKAMYERTSMLQMDPTQAGDYDRLLTELNRVEAGKGVCMNRLYYLAIPPQIYGPLVNLLGQRGLNASCPHGVAATRLLVEKPFGYDSASARELITEIRRAFKEEQVFRIDHYLAKETVQNILAFRFQNPIFEALWDHQHIDSIEIGASEQIGVAERAGFYDAVGALRDVIQTHLLQVLAIVTMDRPAAMDSRRIHASKQAVLEQVRAVPPNQVARRAVRGQYAGYRRDVSQRHSATETFAGIRLAIDSPRWQDVPIILWSGKHLAEKKTEINICFRSRGSRKANYLRLRIQPREGIELDLLAKKPGFETELQAAVMDFSYQQNFVNHEHPNAYERVLVDAVRGDRTLFATSQEVMQAWRIVQPVLDEWAKNDRGLIDYQKGTPAKDLVRALLS